ncbi:MAG TPA: hypothetical protein VI455_16050 [Terriglobia bacterium]
MKIGESRSRKQYHPALNQTLDRRLISYATAAAAAGAGLLGWARPAEAEIVYTTTHVVIGTLGSYALDVNHDGTIDFFIHDVISTNCSTAINAVLAKVVPGNAVQGYRTFSGEENALALTGGARIGPSQGFVSHGRQGEGMVSVFSSPGGGQLRGHWINVTNRYLGLKFQIDGQTHYGWARLTVKVTNVKEVFTMVTGYAYETVPDKPLLAGETSGAEDTPAGPQSLSSTPGGRPGAAGSLGVLALGSGGLPFWRRLEPESEVRSQESE